MTEETKTHLNHRTWSMASSNRSMYSHG